MDEGSDTPETPAGKGVRGLLKISLGAQPPTVTVKKLIEAQPMTGKSAKVDGLLQAPVGVVSPQPGDARKLAKKARRTPKTKFVPPKTGTR